MSLESILSTVGLSAVVGGFVSALVNYLMTMREFKKKSQAELIERRLSLYSFIIYHLDKMKLKGEALQQPEGKKSQEDLYAYEKGELEETIKAVDSKIENRLHLLDYAILKEWIYVKTLMYNPAVTPHIAELRKLLVNEYNNQILLRYEEVVGERLQSIPSTTPR